ncbi:MAG: glycosyltransferase [Opitutaceae bacterium]|nr:glycosyltransferase [Opitutaceae bacterium]
MNILFVNYGDFTSNSINHISGFARELTETGHACIVAVPDRKDTLSVVAAPKFGAATFGELLEKPALFPDGRPADIIHAWTPREVVRRFVLAYKRLAPSRLVVHLEDNEEFLVESYMSAPIAELRESLESDYPKPLLSGLPHPLRYRTLLRLADGVSVIVDTLRQFVPAGTPVLSLPPGVDFTFYRPLPPRAGLRTELGLAENEKVIAFTGSNTFANEREILDLYLAVKLLNEQGVPTRLIRTGFNSPQFIESLPSDWRTWTIDLGFVEKLRLPELLALSDVLVQPGQPGRFNDFRLPSKLPEYLASGRPVITIASNLGLELQDGKNAIVLAHALPQDIADACRRVFEDPEAAARIGNAGVAFARDHFDLSLSSRRLATFYAELAARPLRSVWSPPTDGSDVTLLSRHMEALLQSLPAPSTPVWPEVLSLVGDFSLLSRQLETSAEHAERTLRNACDQLEKDRDEWKRGWRLTDQHAKNITATLEATRSHVANLEQTLAALEKDHERAKAHREHIETLLRSARNRIQSFEVALVEAEQVLGRKSDALALAEQRLEATRNHAKNLEEALAITREDLARNDHWRQRIESELTGAGARITALDASLAKSDYELAQTRARALALGHRSREEIEKLRASLLQGSELIAQRERKIGSMQRSFSWKVTAPLRSLRRLLVDPFTRSKGKEVAGAPAAQVPDSTLAFNPGDFVEPITAFLYSVDYPQTWSFSLSKIVVRGWCLTRQPVPLRKIRARIAGRIFNGVYGLKRMDVLASLRDLPQAEYCGFKIDVTLEESDQEIVLEVADDQGAWHRFFSASLKVGPQHGQPELTSYEQWAATYDSHSRESIESLRQHAATLARRPLISIVMPVYHQKPEDEVWLRKAVDSVLNQAYPHWELCIADDASPAPHVRPLLESLAKKDSRIRPVFRTSNGHISAASNSALAIATGEFTALLDHDDELAPHALYEVAALLSTWPDTDLIYSDEDKIDEEGRRHEPYFKPDFLPDLFTAQNYLSHLSVYRTEIVRSVGGFRVGYEGSQDWDLALRVVERTSPSRIRHIPKVLYHWRAIPGSTAMLLSEKNYPVEAARRALSDHFQRIGEHVELIPVPGDHWRVKRQIPDPPPLVSLIIPSRNGLKLLSRCVDTILAKTDYPNYEIVIVDNGSDDPATLAYLQRIADDRVVVLRYDTPFNYSAINNHGVKHSRGEIIGLLNNDLEIIHGDWLREMVSQAVRPGIGCVGAMLYYPNETIQHAGVIVGLGGVAGHGFRDFPRGTEGRFNRARLVQNYSSVTAACLVVRRAVFEQVGGLDEELAVAFNDIDFCLKVRKAGHLNLWTPFAECYHHESASRGAEDTPEKHERFRREVETMLQRWKAQIAHDPAYNPNLTLELTDFSLAAPPRSWAP